MEREQATLPFVVPSHLSKLFGLKASVIVEGEGDESERQREGGAPLANSTCWGDGETAVVRRWGYKEKYRSTLLSFYIYLSFLFSLFCVINSPSISSPLIRPSTPQRGPSGLCPPLTEREHQRRKKQKPSLLTNWLSGSVRNKTKYCKDRPVKSPRTEEGFAKASVKDEK